MRSTPEKSWTGIAVDLAVDAEVVVEDGVGTHGPHAELVVGQAQRLGELVADVPAARSDAVVELRQALGADHRTPRSVQRPGDRGRRRSSTRHSPSPSTRGVASSGALLGCS